MSTRFRAYQLGTEGSSFSYCHDGHFTLIEARVTEKSIKSLAHELYGHGGGTLECLHITSWDRDHCNPNELDIILKKFKPQRIEFPRYAPHTDSARESKELIRAYEALGNPATSWSPAAIAALPSAQSLKVNNVICWPYQIADDSNNNSTVKLFRTGHFTVLSLGDVEDVKIANYLSGLEILRNEVDVMILAHHGSDNGFTCDSFLSAIRPKVAICTSNYDNQYEHPSPAIRNLLFEHSIRLYTTKTGDVLIASKQTDSHTFRALNFISDNEDISSIAEFKAKHHLP